MSSSTDPRSRGPWVTSAALILLVFGGLGIFYAPFLADGAVGTFLGVGISPLTIVSALNILTGIGLFRLYAWARIAACLVSAFGLLFMHAPALEAAVTNGIWSGIEWLGLVGSVIVLFAVLRRWPADQMRVD